jgi:hypothetical protein
MSDELNAAKKTIEEVLIDLMTKSVISERVMSVGVQASSTRGVQASPSNAHGSRPSRPTTENRTKQKYDLANVKLILTILPDYILNLADALSRDSVPRDFEYIVVTVYLSKGICVLRE